MKKVLVTGANGQLGRCLLDIASSFPKLDITFASKHELAIENMSSVAKYFSENKFDYCINTAAYTNVEKAESESDKVFNVNSPIPLIENCKAHNVALIHISTDYVFDGNKGAPYLETDATNPLNVYGASKLAGEQLIKDELEKYYILRTSWLYSQYGKNFYTTMLRLAKEKNELAITVSETGTPTNANDLARFCLQIVENGELETGTYHYSNEGEGTWYDFASLIFEEHRILDSLALKKTNNYETVAKRPSYSVLSKQKLKDKGVLEIPHWKTSLKGLVNELRQKNLK